MDSLLASPAFDAYAWSTLALIANLFFLWNFSGGVRAGTKTAQNPEDVAVTKGAQIGAENPESVARALRAHSNADANIVPFIFLGGLYVVLGGSANLGLGLFAAYPVFRWLHSFAYLGGKQPWRTLCYAVSTLVLVALLCVDAWMLFSR